MKNINFENTIIKDGFWKFYSELNRNVVVNAIYERFKETGRFDAINCNWREGMPNKPHVFWDSDVAKWIEGASYLINTKPEPELEKLIDDMVDIIAANQRKDGYFNSYFLTIEPANIFTKRYEHELYCAGHMIEAAVAYHKATGKDKLLNCVIKYIDMIYQVFVEEESASFCTPGHEEIELALLKLYEHKKIEKHLELARFFINQRGNNEKDEKNEIDCAVWPIKDALEVGQSNLPLREITEAVGHGVRTGYIYTAMAMLARIDNDKELKDACDRVFEDIINHKMSITGGVGAEPYLEKFSYKYDIPNSDTYNETCAAVAHAMFSGAMQEIEANSRYGDRIERICYNGFLSGLSLSGDKFFYTNPLEIDRKKYVRSTYQPICERQKMFTTSCCPPNVLRTIATIAQYAYSIDEDAVYCNQFINSETKFTIDGEDAVIKQITDYPNSGKITFEYSGKPITFYVRIPDWCVEYKGETEKGFARFELSNGDCFTLELPMEVHFIEANPYVQYDSGRYAVQRGPIVYCMEEIDNGENLRDITLLESSDIIVKNETDIPAPVIYINAERRPNTNSLYTIKNNERISFTARLIPYFSFANREATDMIVWTMVK